MRPLWYTFHELSSIWRKVYYYYYYLYFFSRTTWVSRYQKGKTSLDLNEARDDGVSGWWHKLDNVQTICTSLQKFREITTSAAHHSVEGFNRLLVKYEEKN